MAPKSCRLFGQDHAAKPFDRSRQNGGQRRLQQHHGGHAMRNGRVDLTRRQYLAASAGLVAAGLSGARPAFALETVRQGFQTNIWGMPTYYLLKSGLLEKQGIKFEEFAVPS